MAKTSNLPPFVSPGAPRGLTPIAAVQFEYGLVERSAGHESIPMAKRGGYWPTPSVVPLSGTSQQAQMLQVGDVFVDQCGRQVWNVFVGADFGCLYRGPKHLGGRGGAAQRLFGFAIGAEQGQY